ncbi:hypothetical protein [Arthrobacter sp. YD4]|uniref:hypothetical protein n=1 Tax=Arthrobacter sp. YD4 TaxID=3058043 RepID=UPI0025B3CA3A|nr:hypothetical protein [Arthrobacter sp. YD4]
MTGALTLVAILAGTLSGCAAQPTGAVQPGPAQAGSAAAGPTDAGRAPGPVGGYEGWWNSTPASGDAHGLPAETVAINTRTNQVVDAFNRSINEAGRPTKISDVDYIVTPDPSWPKDSVVIIDTTTRQVIADFRVDAAGEPIR